MTAPHRPWWSCIVQEELLILHLRVDRKKEGRKGERKEPFSPYEGLNASLLPVLGFTAIAADAQRTLGRRTQDDRLKDGFSGRQDRVLGSMRLEGACPKEQWDPKQAIKDRVTMQFFPSFPRGLFPRYHQSGMRARPLGVLSGPPLAYWVKGESNASSIEALESTLGWLWQFIKVQYECIVPRNLGEQSCKKEKLLSFFLEMKTRGFSVVITLPRDIKLVSGEAKFKSRSSCSNPKLNRFIILLSAKVHFMLPQEKHGFYLLYRSCWRHVGHFGMLKGSFDAEIPP